MARSRRTPGWFLTSAVAAFVLAACGHDSERSDPRDPTVDTTRSQELQRNQFSDVPTPNGFSYVNAGNWSFSYSQGGVRVGRFRYLGSDPVDEVIDFYKRTMPLRAFDWQFVSEDGTAPGPVTLRFRKGRQDCEVAVSSQAGTTFINIEVKGAA